MDGIKPVVDNNFYASGCSNKEAKMKNKQTTYTKPQVNKEDVLAAVKVDPAVLEARVTFTTNEENVKTSATSSKDFAEKEEVLGTSSSVNSETSFERVISMQKASLMSLSSEQLTFLLMYTDYLRKKRLAVNKPVECAFCKKSGRSASWYTRHGLRDGQGRILCPVLRAYRCPCCGATGDHAHTVKYCPENIDLM